MLAILSSFFPMYLSRIRTTKESLVGWTIRWSRELFERPFDFWLDRRTRSCAIEQPNHGILRSTESFALVTDEELGGD